MVLGQQVGRGRERTPNERRDFWHLMYGLNVAAFLTMALVAVQNIAPAVLRFDHSLADLRTAVLSDRLPAQHPRIAVVLIDEQTLENEPYYVADRGITARLVRKLDDIGAKAIALDFVYYRATEPAKDAELEATIRSARASIILAAGDSRADIDEKQRAYQTDFIARVGRAAGYANLYKDSDDVVRRKAPPADDAKYPQSFAALIAAEDGFRDPDPSGRIAWLKRAVNGEDSFLTLNALDILEDGPVAALIRPKIKDRLVIVGGGFADRDRHLTPLFTSDGARGSKLIHGVFLHAHAVAQILDVRPVKELPNIPTIFMISLAGFFLGLSFRKHGFSFQLASWATGVLIALDLFLFWKWRHILPYTPATIAWFVSGFIGYTLGKYIGLVKS